MSYPPGPPPGPYGQQQPGYGYPQQPPPGYGYPQYPGGAPGMLPRMPGLVVTARVLLFVAGSLWVLLGLIILITGMAAQEAVDGLPVADGAGDAAAGIALVFFLLFGGLGALHIVPASMFGKGAAGTRVTAIIAASLNSALAVLALLASLGNEYGTGNPFIAFLWLGTAVITIVFAAMSQAGAWFNRPRYY